MVRCISIFISVLLISSFAQAEPGVFVGITYNIGASSTGFGVSVKGMTTNEEDAGAVVLGATYYPFAKENKFGVDVGAGYLFQNGAVTLSWDILCKKPQVGVGYVNTEEDDDRTIATPVQASDRRLKREIGYLTTLENGINLYSFKYLWSNEIYIGVMAQDLLLNSAHRKAVVRARGNYYAVDYQSLGLKMITLDEWHQSHENIFCSLPPACEAGHG
jgi:hypothetical protein